MLTDTLHDFASTRTKATEKTGLEDVLLYYLSKVLYKHNKHRANIIIRNSGKEHEKYYVPRKRYMYTETTIDEDKIQNILWLITSTIQNDGIEPIIPCKGTTEKTYEYFMKNRFIKNIEKKFHGSEFDRIADHLFGDIYSPVKGEGIVHMICDSGLGKFGEHCKNKNARIIYTPQTKFDSATANALGIATNYQPAYEFKTITSDSNVFTKDRFRISYKNIPGHTYEKNNEAFIIHFFSNKDNFGIDIPVENKNGPSVNTLIGCFLEAEPSTSPDIKARSRALIEKARSSEVDIHTNLEGFATPELYLDIKRCGDRDQVKAAYMLQHEYINVVFCTADKLCALTAMRAGLNVILYSNTKEEVSVFKSVPEIAQWGGGIDENIDMQTNIYNNRNMHSNMPESNDTNMHIEIPESEDENERVYTIEEFIQIICSRAASGVRMSISKMFPIIHKLCFLYQIQYEIRISKNPSKSAAFRNVVSSYESVYGPVDISTIQHQIDNIERMFTDDTRNRDRYLATDSSELAHTIVSFVRENFVPEKNLQFSKQGREIYSSIMTVLEPYNEKGEVKAGHPYASLIDKHTTRNLYTCGLVSLSLLHDILQGAAKEQVSVVSKFILQKNYHLDTYPALNTTTLLRYNAMLFTVLIALLRNANLPPSSLRLASSGGYRNTRNRRHRKKRTMRRTSGSKNT